MINRDNLGRFTSLKVKAKRYATGAVLLGIVGACIYAGVTTSSHTVVEAQTKPTISRTQQVQQIIDQLAAAREKDSTFIAETQKEEEELQHERHQAAITDALMIIKTQYDVVLSDLTNPNK